MTLNDLGLKYGTDKSTIKHGYLDFYESTLPKQPARILEIGCYKGASIRMWREYFPDAEIHTLDLFELDPIPTDIPGVIYHKGNQCDYIILDKLRTYNFDIIIDDGSHGARDMMITFFGLIHRQCYYYIEDLHCNNEEFYSQGLPTHWAANTIFSTIRDCNMYYSKNIVLVKGGGDLC